MPLLERYFLYILQRLIVEMGSIVQYLLSLRQSEGVILVFSTWPTKDKNSCTKEFKGIILLGTEPLILLDFYSNPLILGLSLTHYIPEYSQLLSLYSWVQSTPLIPKFYSSSMITDLYSIPLIYKFYSDSLVWLFIHFYSIRRFILHDLYSILLSHKFQWTSSIPESNSTPFIPEFSSTPFFPEFHSTPCIPNFS